ncbi:MAG: M48 family metallopeptidase [Bacillota bacterium]
MQPRFNVIWLTLIVLVGVFSLTYIWFTLFPGRVAPETGQYFTAEQVNRGREYNQALRLVYITGLLAQGAFLVWLVFGGRAAALSRWAQHSTGGSYWGSLLLFFLALWLLLRLINLPFTLYSSFYWQHRWGFSTQTMGSWWMDYLKGAGLDLALSAVGVALLFWFMNRWPGAWWLAGAAFFSLWLVVQSLLWPVVVSPLFNRFVPAKDPALITMVRQLSNRAGLPVDQVLIMDASERTTKANAYFTGLGPTKRIVLYDTLLANYPPDEVEAVVAHEMAHWRHGHIIKGLAFGVLGNFIFWGLLFLLLRSTMPPSLSQPPHTWAVILLFFLLAFFISSPLQNHISRGMEEEADRAAVTLTGNAPAAVRLQLNLATRNLSDLSPPAYIRWFSYSHPPALDRIKTIRQTGRGAGPGAK